MNPRQWDDPKFFAGCPTRDQAKRIWWQDLKRLTPKPWVDRIYDGDLIIRTTWGAELHVLGLDVPERVEGTPWEGCVVDELANCRPGTWESHVLPSLSTPGRLGWAWLIGVPDAEAPGQVEYQRMWDLARSGIDPEWEGFHWPSADILDPQEVENRRRTMDPDLFNQEYGGAFILTGGLAFPTFSAKEHTTANAVYDKNLPVCWCLDFNVNPMCSGIVQHHRGQVRVIKEFTLSHSSTDGACDAFLEYVEKNRIDLSKGLFVYGDPSGHARDTTSDVGVTDWVIVGNRLKHLKPQMRVPRSHSPVKDTLNAVRALLRSADGSAHLSIHPGCQRLIRDFTELLWPSDLSEGHCVAWLRYFADREYPVLINRDGENARVVVAA